MSSHVPVSKSSTQGVAAHPPHPITFRVMRLTSPLPTRTSAPPLIPAHLPQSESSDFVIDTPIWHAEGAPCGVAYLTVLPSSFGSIFSSEAFRSFVSVYNRSSDPLYDISITAHIQTASSRRIELIHSSDHSRSILQSRGSINTIINVRLSELGLHTLVCTATYKDTQANPSSSTSPHSSSAPRTLRQYFKFNVLPPVDTSPSVHPLYRKVDIVRLQPMIQYAIAVGIGPHYLVHVRVINALPTAIFNTTATFKPSPPFHQRPLGVCNQNPKEESVLCTRRAIMGSGDARNFIFLVMSHVSEALWVPSRRLRTTTDSNDGTHNSDSVDKPEGRETRQRERDLGMVVVKWSSALGEDGSAERKVRLAPRGDEKESVSLTIYAVPNEVKVHQPFVARCAARNNSTRPLRLYLQIRRDLVGEVVPVGVSGVGLGQVNAGQTARCAITLLGLVRGQHDISGVRVVDMESNVSYKADTPSITVL